MSLTDNNIPPVLFALENITVTLGGLPVLENFSLRMGQGEAVALTGASGSGKTVLAHTIAGRHFFRGDYSVSDGHVENFQRGVQVVEQQHRFRNRNQTADQYYQQRYNSLNAAETVTIAEDLEPYGEGSNTFPKQRLLELFGIDRLLNEPLIQLSNGENKRLQMVKALLLPHTLLILDQPFTGLDAAGRKALSGVLDELSAGGETMLLICSGRDIPGAFQRVIVIDHGKLISDGPEFPADAGSRKTKKNLSFSRPVPATRLFDFPSFDFAFRLQHVNIRYDERLILDDVSWSVRRGECWSLSGPNGAGKSTLLSLVTGDNPQAYSNEIALFDRARGTGESIWEIKQKTGLVSPELHLFFDPGATVFAAIASGLFDTIGLFRVPDETETALVKEWISFLGLDDEEHVLLNRLPAGKQRIALLGRALIKHPPLLILDEPCQGLDESDIEAVKGLVDRYCRGQDATLVYVSHYPDEWPSCITRHAGLEKGRLFIND